MIPNGKAYSKSQRMGRECWLRSRSGTIGASEAAAILGISPWMTAADVWERKLNKSCSSHEETNEDISRGVLSESHIRELYAIETGWPVADGTGIILRSNKHPFMSCTLDGVVLEDNGPVILEIKSVRGSQYSSWEGDRIPDHYFCQLLHQLAVTEWNEARILARFARSREYSGATERVYSVFRDGVMDQIEKLIEAERRFWVDNVQMRVRPAVKLPAI